jgi:hypothetical protein
VLPRPCPGMCVMVVAGGGCDGVPGKLGKKVLDFLVGWDDDGGMTTTHTHSTQLTLADLDRALLAHVECLAAVGIVYDGDLVLSHGSASAGRAFGLFRTNVPATDGSVLRSYMSPPIGSDFLGMTKRDAYMALTGRTGDIYQTVDALRRSTTVTS